jgi:glutaredoxin-like YruB-family protein
MSIVVYTTPTCGYCHQLKSYLRQREVPFAEYDVSRDRRAAADMVRLSGQQGVPVTLIDGEVVVGFDRPAIDRLLARQPAARPKLGVAIAAAERISAQKGLPLPSGAYIGRVNADSPAERAGLRSGDVILELAGQVVHTDADVHRILANAPTGRSVDLLLWREGQRIQAAVRL